LTPLGCNDSTSSFLIELGTRRVPLPGVTAPPNGARATPVARNLTTDLPDAGSSFTILLRDRNTKSISSFDKIIILGDCGSCPHRLEPLVPIPPPNTGGTPHAKNPRTDS
jgi:hypothetical protein